MLVFVDKITERLIYTFDFIFSDRKITYQFTNDWFFFEKFEGLKFSYSERIGTNEVKIQPATVLFDEQILMYDISLNPFYKEDCLTFNTVTDPFASIFFILSRMEEYTVKQRDFHDRFQLKNSVLHKFSLSKKVVCDRWAEDIVLFLEKNLVCSLKAEKIPTKVICTFDIDNTFAYKWKEGLRRLLSLGKDYLKNDKNRILERKQVEKGEIIDPYDTFEYIKSLHNKNVEVLLFWLLGDYNKYDKNISGNDLRHQQLIQEISKTHVVNLHPSYESNSSNLILKNEKKLLELILGKTISSSRQHYLKLQLPTTYTNLISESFTDDYSMGFAEEIGFRAGTTRSFYFFDLFSNSKTNLRIHPFAYMDGTLNLYLKLTPEQAKVEIQKLYQEVLNFGGDFIFIWHNETINNQGKWENWLDVFEYSINLENEI